MICSYTISKALLFLHIKCRCLQVPEFELTEEQSNMVTAGWCPNALDIQGGYVRKTICSLHNDTLAPVDIDIADNVYIHYRNPQQYYARIWIVLQGEIYLYYFIHIDVS